tara:strand:+ start:259 stop:444 length:186 start_codon:yes stop_codon:yes gene_type:complete
VHILEETLLLVVEVDMLVLVVVAQVVLVRVDHPMLLNLHPKLHLMVPVVLDFKFQQHLEIH